MSFAAALAGLLPDEKDLGVPDAVPGGQDAAVLEDECKRNAPKLHVATTTIYLYSSMLGSLASHVPVAGIHAYIDEFHRQAGASGDPLETVLLDQLILAFHAIGRLHTQAAACSDLTKSAVAVSSAARLLAEVRRTVMALQAYRAASGPRQRDAEKKAKSGRRRAASA